MEFGSQLPDGPGEKDGLDCELDPTSADVLGHLGSIFGGLIEIEAVRHFGAAADETESSSQEPDQT